MGCKVRPFLWLLSSALQALTISHSEANTVARLYNSTVNNSTTPFYPLQNRRNEPVDGFPLNGEELANLSRKNLCFVL